uniref:Uncharacterized protein n=1 Tax=Tanacetum cinerariifolium TaxID=118510 RepID=A0A699ISV1_TANCI|nr:hypothetical protein [Tanacetum cinerariifolium]
MNGWKIEVDEEEVKANEEDEEEMEAEEDEDMEVNDNKDENHAEIIQPYEEVNPFNRAEKNNMRMDSFDDDLTALYSTLRDQIQEMKKFMAELNERLQQIQERDIRAENEMLRIRLRATEEKAKIRNQLPLKRRYRERPYDPSTNTTSHPRCDDPYVMVRDNAVCADAASDHDGKGVDTTDVVKDAGE